MVHLWLDMWTTLSGLISKVDRLNWTTLITHAAGANGNFHPGAQGSGGRVDAYFFLSQLLFLALLIVSFLLSKLSSLKARV